MFSHLSHQKPISDPQENGDIPICRVTLLRDLSPAGQQVSNRNGGFEAFKPEGRWPPSNIGILSLKIWALLGGFGGISTFKHDKIESNENRRISTGWGKKQSTIESKTFIDIIDIFPMFHRYSLSIFIGDSRLIVRLSLSDSQDQPRISADHWM